jgi:ligand-binding SRPBCC domain-containing protein
MISITTQGVTMSRISKTTEIACSIEELFAFHTDSNNIKEITPPNIKVELLNEDGQTYEGKIVQIKTTKFFIPTYWEVKIEKLQSPYILVDVAIKSPFKKWRHQHIFTQKESTCELKDVIEYEMPFGILGKIVEPLIRYDIEKMFAYRHVKTREILEGK